MKHKVAVYGTLRPGTGKTAVIPGRIYDLGSFPGLVLDGSLPGVTVELIEVDDRHLGQLDRYEGYIEKNPEMSLYIRREVDFGSGPFFVYEYNDVMDNYKPVDSGDWLEYKGQSAGSAAVLATGGY